MPIACWNIYCFDRVLTWAEVSAVFSKSVQDMTPHSRGISSSHFLARSVQCVNLRILMLLSLISSLVLSSCFPSLIHFLHLCCASPFGYPALGRTFDISAGQARLSQLSSATDSFSVCFLKYYTDKILRIAILGQTKGQAHTVLLDDTLPVSNHCQLRNIQS